MNALHLLLVAVVATGCATAPAPAPRALPPVQPAPPSAPAASAAAADTVRTFVERLDAAYQLGQPYPVTGIADTRCHTCHQLAGYADSMARAGHHVVGTSFTDLTVEAAPVEGDHVYVSLTALAPSRREVDAAGRVVRRDPDAGRLRWTVVVVREAGGWRLRAWLKDPS